MSGKLGNNVYSKIPKAQKSERAENQPVFSRKISGGRRPRPKESQNLYAQEAMADCSKLGKWAEMYREILNPMDQTPGRLKNGLTGLNMSRWWTETKANNYIPWSWSFDFNISQNPLEWVQFQNYSWPESGGFQTDWTAFSQIFNRNQSENDWAIVVLFIPEIDYFEVKVSQATRADGTGSFQINTPSRTGIAFQGFGFYNPETKFVSRIFADFV